MDSDYLPAETDPLVEIKSLTRSFPGVLALDQVDFELQAGHVHALLGENGAGKSTLIKVLAGLLKPDSGRIHVAGKPLEHGSPASSDAAGIRVVYQELSLVGPLSIRENICLGSFPKNPWRGIDWDQTDERARRGLRLVGLDVDLNSPVEELGMAEQQLVEIARALSRDERVLILDEPTSSLSQTESDRLFQVIRELTNAGVGIIYVTHRLDEVEAIADEVTVLRDGKRVMQQSRGTWTRMDIVRAMVGKDLAAFERQYAPRKEDEALRADNLFAGVLQDVSFTLYAGEVLGVFGLVGAGLESLGRALFGAVPITGGSVSFAEQEMAGRFTPRLARRLGLGYLSADRQRDGIISELSVRKNVTVAALDAFATYGWLDRSAEGRGARSLVERLRIRTPSLGQRVAFLSGGNQQKVLLARWLMTNPKALILAEPTRGVDVGAKAEIYKIIDDVTEAGMGVLLLSTDAEEVSAVCDRALALRSGRVVAEFEGSSIKQQRLLSAVTHADPEEERGA